MNMLLQISSLLNYLSLHRSLEIKLSSMAFLLINQLIFRFQKMLSSGAKYDVIVDGLNVALYRWPKVRSKDFNQQSFSVSPFTRVTGPLTTEGIQTHWGSYYRLQSGLEIRTWKTERHPITELFKSR